MRNLTEYPVTREEIIAYLLGLLNDLDPNLIGDMRPLLLSITIHYIAVHCPHEVTLEEIAGIKNQWGM